MHPYQHVGGYKYRNRRIDKPSPYLWGSAFSFISGIVIKDLLSGNSRLLKIIQAILFINPVPKKTELLSNNSKYLAKIKEKRRIIQ